MDQSTIGLIILLAAVVLYCTELIPLYITSILAALAMVFAGIIDFTTAFSSMGSSTIMLIIGMFIVGKAIAEVGIADIVGRFLIRILRGSERTAIVLICLVTASTSFFVNPIYFKQTLEYDGGKHDVYFVFLTNNFGGNYNYTTRTFEFNMYLNSITFDKAPVDFNNQVSKQFFRNLLFTCLSK